jgi:hypothetical protein
MIEPADVSRDHQPNRSILETFHQIHISDHARRTRVGLR